MINIDQIYVCEDGESVQTGFPNGLRDKIADGAQLGRCEHLNGWSSPLSAGLPYAGPG